MKTIYGRNGLVVNVVTAPDVPASDVGAWIVSDSTAVSVGDAFDPKDPQIDAMDTATFRTLLRHENMIRQLIRAVRTNAGINTAATSAGLPVNAPDLSLAQARDAFKALLP